MRKITLSIVCLIVLGINVLLAQQVQVSGVVTDAIDGQGLPGVSVVIKGTSKSAATNANGRYTISAPSDATLVFTFLGSKTHEEAVAGRTTINVTLESDAVKLEDVVVVGYGTGKKIGTVIGAITRISAEKIGEKPVANVMDALQGKVAGLQIYTSSGEPSSVSSVRLHGKGSLGSGTEPLYILDGMPVESGTILGINPNDFESVTVLKDASSTSIYGARGANGVIYYTTKRGVSGDAVITARAQYGVSSLANTFFIDRLMNTKQLTEYYVATGYATKPEVEQLLNQYPNDTKWGNWFFTDAAPNHQVDLSIRGGKEKTTYFISGSLFGQDGLAPHSGYERYTLRSNIDSKATNWLRLGMNITGYYDKSNTARGMNGPYDNGGFAYLMLPYYTPYDADGNESHYINGMNMWNPKYIAERESYASAAEAIASGYIEITPIKNLTIKSLAGLDVLDENNVTTDLPSRGDMEGEGAAYRYFARGVRSIITNTVEYKFNVKDDHAITLLAGQEGVDYKNDGFEALSTGQTDDRLMLLQHGKSTVTANSGLREYAFLSFFGRADYNYKEKYFADFSVRNDQSSRFGKDDRSATFFSGSLMWDAKKEDFLHDFDWLNELSLRGSFGSSGNAEIGDYTHLALVGSYAQSYHKQGATTVANPGNSHLTWEKQTLATITLKAKLWEQLSAELSFYNRVTSSMLFDVPYPYTSGFDAITANVGKLQNRGIDITLNWDILKTKEAYLTFSTVFNYNTNKVLELFNGYDRWDLVGTGITYAVGQSVNFYYPIRAGIDPADGKQIWYTPGDDKTVKTTDETQTTKTFSATTLLQNTGKPLEAPITGGFGFSGGWNGFALEANFIYVAGKYLLNNDRYFTENPSLFLGQLNQSQDVMDYWKQPGDVTTFPKVGEKIEFDDHLIENASFLRLKALTLSYTVPTPWLKKTNVLKGLKVYLTGRNLFTLTKYLGIDPEIDQNLTRGAYPNTRQYVAGIEITF